jgi:prepilin-type N-terminal cleavage/methylation domain-containing protein
VKRKASSGVTLLELLVTVTVIAALASVVIPSWTSLSRAHARRAAIGIVMDMLEGARVTAQGAKKNVWVIFRHTEDKTPDSLRVVTMETSGATPQGSWLKLPAVISFRGDKNNLMEEAPPEDVLVACLNGKKATSGEIFGSIMFLPSGRIGVPKPGGKSLKLDFSSTSGTAPGSVVLSRASGRASYQ